MPPPARARRRGPALTDVNVRLSPPAEPGGVAALAIQIARTGPAAAAATDRRDRARAEERHNLKLALATFAAQLDAFEARATLLLGAGEHRVPTRNGDGRPGERGGKDGTVGQ
jgi:hypothetical protein